MSKAAGLAEAHRKVVKIGKAYTKPYKSGADAIDVQWLFEGVIDLLPVYEEIEDGAEIMWAERTKTLKNIRKHAKDVAVFGGRKISCSSFSHGKMRHKPDSIS